MNKLTKLSLSASIAAAALFGVSTIAFAATTCSPVYGGGQNCITSGQLSINKTVKNPVTGQFVDNLGLNDPKFSANDVVPFEITVTNTSGSTINNITVTDNFPSLIPCNAGPGTCTNNQNVFTIGTLNAGQSQTFDLSGRVVASLPNQSVICDGTTTNTAIAQASGQPTVQDTAQVCVQNQVLAATPGVKGGVSVFPPPSVTATPKTGPEALALVALLPTGLLGKFLRKKSSK